MLETATHTIYILKQTPNAIRILAYIFLFLYLSKYVSVVLPRTDEHGSFRRKQEIILHVELVVLYGNLVCHLTAQWLSLDSAIIKIII